MIRETRYINIRQMWKPPLHCDRGIAALPITLSIMGIVLLVSVTLALVGFSDIFTSKSSGEAKEAFYIAEFGAQDALIRLSRGVTSSPWNEPEPPAFLNLWAGITDAGVENSNTTWIKPRQKVRIRGRIRLIPWGRR